jgi:transcriptional regulator with XRE-family HTH domain
MVLDVTLRPETEVYQVPAGYRVEINQADGEPYLEKTRPKRSAEDPQAPVKQMVGDVDADPKTVGRLPDPKTPGEWYKGLREQAALSQEEVAEILETGVEEVEAVENNMSSPYQVTEIFMLAKAIGISADAMLETSFVPPAAWQTAPPAWATFLQVHKFNTRAVVSFQSWLKKHHVGSPELLPKEVLVALLPYFRDAVKARRRKKRKKAAKKKR